MCLDPPFARSGGPLPRVEEKGLNSPWTPCVLRVGGAPDSGPPEANRDWRNRDFPNRDFSIPIAIFLLKIAIGFS